MVKTQYFKEVFDKDNSVEMFNYLRYNTQWEEGIRSKKGFTRLAKSINPSEDDIILNILVTAFKKLNLKNLFVYGCYLNFYKDGEYYTPNHTHPGTIQLVISFNEDGRERILTVGKKDYLLENGSCVIFGSSAHGIPKAKDKKGRISIATFMKDMPELNGKIAFQEQ